MLDTPVTFHTTGSTASFRLATYLRSLRRPKALAMILLVALFPAAIERAVALAAPGPGPTLELLGVGVCAAALMVALGALVAVLRSGRPRALTFDEHGIREEVGGRTVAHPWAWVLAVFDDERTITLHCEQPMRSFRLASSADRLVLVIDKSSPGVERLLTLLRAHAPDTVRLG